MRLGALEAGGTKMVCGVGNENGDIFEQMSFPTETPEITVPKLVEFYQEQKIDALGIACFGPIDLNRKSPKYGYITTTPKLAWADFPIVQEFEKALQVPVGFDTDVNGSLLGEATWGAARGIENAIYITVGTGVGAGIMVNGQLLHGMLHPEAGHILLQKRADDTFGCRCPYHTHCLEGLAAGPAIEERWGKKGAELTDYQPVWELEAYYIGQALVNYICTLSPQIIILGGGVMQQKQLLPMVRSEVEKQLGGYLKTKELSDLEHYIVAPQLMNKQGIMGCMVLAMQALQTFFT